jgi:hypothetical protein
MDSLIALLTILRYNPSLKSIDLSRPIPQYQYTNWMNDVAIHIAQMLEVIIYLEEKDLNFFLFRKIMFYKKYMFKNLKFVIQVLCGFVKKCNIIKHYFFLILVGMFKSMTDQAKKQKICIFLAIELHAMVLFI